MASLCMEAPARRIDAAVEVPSSAWLAIAELAAAAIVMTIAMVQFTAAIIEPEPSGNARSVWGLAYALAWLAIVWSITRIAAGAEPAPSIVWTAVFACAAWATLNALWIVFWSAIARANRREGLPA